MKGKGDDNCGLPSALVVLLESESVTKVGSGVDSK